MEIRENCQHDDRRGQDGSQCEQGGNAPATSRLWLPNTGEHARAQSGRRRHGGKIPQQLRLARVDPRRLPTFGARGQMLLEAGFLGSRQLGAAGK